MLLYVILVFSGCYQMFSRCCNPATTLDDPKNSTTPGIQQQCTALPFACTTNLCPSFWYPPFPKSCPPPCSLPCPPNFPTLLFFSSLSSCLPSSLTSAVLPALLSDLRPAHRPCSPRCKPTNQLIAASALFCCSKPCTPIRQIRNLAHLSQKSTTWWQHFDSSLRQSGCR
jgi:hypothetical protein